MDKRIVLVIVLYIILFGLGLAGLKMLFRQGGFGDTMVIALNLTQMQLDDPEEYRGEFAGYQTHTYYSDSGSSESKKYATYEYEAAGGELRTVESVLTDEERGRKLPASVTVLDDGANAYIQNDFDDMKAIAQRGFMAVGLLVLILISAAVVWIVMQHLFRKRPQSTAPEL